MQMEGSETQIITLTVQNYLDHRLQLFAIPNYIKKIAINITEGTVGKKWTSREFN